MKTLLRVLRQLLLALLVLVAIVSIAGYATAPLLSQQTSRLAEYLAAWLGTPVAIGSMTMRWRLLGPSMELHDVTLGDTNQPVRVEQAVVTVNFPDLVSRAESAPFSITLRGMQLRLIRELDKRLHMPGWQLGITEDTATARGSLPAQIRLLDAAIIWEDRYHERAPLTIEPITIDLKGGIDGIKIAGILDSAHGQVEFAADLSGDLTTTDWSGRSRIDFRNLDLARLTGDYLPQHYRLAGSILNGRFDAYWANAIPSASSGTLRLSDIEISGDETLRFDEIGGAFVYNSDNDGWALNLRDVAVSRNGRAWPTSEIAIRAARDFTRLRVAAEFLRIEDLMAVFKIRAPAAQLLATADELQPRGDLRDTRLDVDIGQNSLQWRAAAQLHGMHIERSSELPGISNVTGVLRARSDHVQFDLDSTDVAINFGDLFPAPLQVDKIRGRLDWQESDNHGWTVRSHELLAENADIATRSRLHVEKPADRPLSVDLQTDFDSEDIRNFGAYLPVRIMRPSLVRWLNESIAGGKIGSGTFALQGPLKDFPYDKTHSGHFEVLFDISNAKLNYLDAWPPLENMAAELRFHNNSLTIDLSSATIYDSQVARAAGSFVTLNPVSPLTVIGSVQGPLADHIRLLRESPLRNKFQAFANAIKPSGQSELDLSLTVPMNNRGRNKLDGTMRLLDAGLDLTGWDLPLRKINGALRFDLDSIAGRNIKARGLNSRLSVDVEPQAAGTRVSAAGVLNSPTLQSLVPKLPLQHLSGSSPFDVAFVIPHPRAAATKTILLDVRSDLRGIAVNAPQPLGKSAGENRRLELSIPLSGSDQALRIRYGEQVSAVVSQDYRRAEIRLGGKSAQLPSGQVFSLRGNLATLAIDRWLDWLPSSYGGSDLPDLTTRLRLGELTFGDSRVRDTAISAQRNQGTWRGSVDSALAKGRFRIPPAASTHPVKIDLDYLRLDTEQDPPQSTPLDNAKRFDPHGWPAIEFHSKRLQINRASLGALTFSTQPRPRGLRIAGLRVDGDLAQLDVTGDWQYQSQGSVSRFRGVLATPDLGELLEELAFEKQLANGEARVEFDLSWPGDPSLLTAKRYTGTLDLDIERGRFLDIDPGVTRVVGLLNFNALQRRLRLDFSDLFRKGLSFDRVTGHFTLDDGQAYTNDLTLTGPSGRIEVAGRTGLTSRDMDQLVSVTPRLDATLPVAGAIAGGPLAGLAVLLAQQVMSDQVDQINRFHYSIKGPWAAPKIEETSKGGSLSKLLRPFSGTPSATPDARAPQTPSRPHDSVATDSETLEPNDLPPANAGGAPVEPKNLVDKLLDKIDPKGSGSEYLDSSN